MSRFDNTPSRPPLWFCIVLVLMSLPLLGYPQLLALILDADIEGIDKGTMRFVVYLLPLYVVGSQWISFRIYNERKTEAWILQAMLLIVYMCCLWLGAYIGTTYI